MKRVICLFLVVVSFQVAYSQVEKWEILQGKDEFGDLVPNDYTLQSYGEGEFSNSVSLEESLSVFLYIQKADIVFGILEYGKYKASLGNTEYGKLIVRKDNGLKETFTVRVVNTFLAIMGDTSDRAKMIDILKENKELKFLYQKNINQVYKFTINCNGFASKYKEICSKWEQMQ